MNGLYVLFYSVMFWSVLFPSIKEKKKSCSGHTKLTAWPNNRLQPTLYNIGLKNILEVNQRSYTIVFFFFKKSTANKEKPH